MKGFDRCLVLRRLLETVDRDPVLRRAFEKTIKPILVGLKSASLEELVFRFVYTIVDQRRDVEDVVIPCWFTFRLTGVGIGDVKKLGVEFLEEVFACLLQEYGHQDYFPRGDAARLNRELVRGRLKSRARAVADALVKASCFEGYAERLVGRRLDFKRFVEECFDRLMLDAGLREKFVDLFEMFGVKSLEFFLRDVGFGVVDFDTAPVPVDVHVASSCQLLGLYYSDEELESILQGDLSVVFSSSERERFAGRVGLRLRGLMKECGLDADDVLRVSQGLFLVGSCYCSERGCGVCPLRNVCFYQFLLRFDADLAERFRIRIGGRDV